MSAQDLIDELNKLEDKDTTIFVKKEGGDYTDVFYTWVDPDKDFCIVISDSF